MKSNTSFSLKTTIHFEWSNFYYRRLESTEDDYGYSLKIVTIAAACPVTGVATYTNRATASLLTFERAATLTLSFSRSPNSCGNRSS